jgi:hypothetical protein
MAPYDEAPMEHFVHRENLQRLRRLLTETADKSRRQQILKLLAEEEAKDYLPPRENHAQSSRVGDMRH